MSYYQSQLLLKLVLIIWFLTLGRSIVIMLGGNKLFKKAGKGEKTAYYPLINLFAMLELCDVTEYLGILFFVPIANVIVLMIMSIKYSSKFNLGFLYTIGLLFLPIVFYPLSFTKYDTTTTNSNKFSGIESSKNNFMLDDKINKEYDVNFMTDEDINNLNSEENNYITQENIDSIFKGKVELQKDKIQPYKATKNKETLTSELNSTPKPKQEVEFVELKEEKKDIEFIDL